MYNYEGHDTEELKALEHRGERGVPGFGVSWDFYIRVLYSTDHHNWRTGIQSSI
jgi:hypothetical protein